MLLVKQVTLRSCVDYVQVSLPVLIYRLIYRFIYFILSHQHGSVGLGIEPRASCMGGRYYTELHISPLAVNLLCLFTVGGHHLPCVFCLGFGLLRVPVL